MRIWIAAAQRKENFGGVHRSMTSLAGALERQGHTVTLVWSRGEGRREQAVFAFRLVLRLLLSVFRRPHWIIARSSDGLLCSLAARIGLAKTRVALHSHGWEEKVYAVEKRLPRSVITNPTTYKAHFLRFPLLRLALAVADACVCGTVEEARWLRGRYARERFKIGVVPNGVHAADKPFWPGQEELPPSFLAVGPCTWKKNLDYTLDLFSRVSAQVKEARLFCIGTGNLPPRLRGKADALGDSLYLVEHEAPQKMDRWYETCPYLISSSRYEGGRSLAVLEAMNRGMTVFAAAIPSTREFIRDGRNGVLLAGCDAERDGATIVNTVARPELCRRLGLAAFRFAGRQSWDRQAKRLLRILNSKK